jgi:hypothetical protein
MSCSYVKVSDRNRTLSLELYAWYSPGLLFSSSNKSMRDITIQTVVLEYM